eukprot:4016008-Ditylum_brightwellii.AAC.1
MRQDGHITEALYDELGFPRDHEENEYGADCTVGIERKHMQRTKPLTHPEQVALREAYKSSLMEKEIEKVNKKLEKEKKDTKEI